jgi:hypothetical protein
MNRDKVTGIQGGVVGGMESATQLVTAGGVKTMVLKELTNDY